MIKINLLGDQAAVETSSSWFLLGWGLSLIVSVVLFFMVLAKVNSNIERYEQDRDSLQRQLDALLVKTKEVTVLEAKKRELAEKTAVIGTLRKSKTGPVRVMDDLNTAVPERAWLQQINEASGLMRITGFGIDNQTIAMFMKGLEGSRYFDKVDLEETKQVDRLGVRIKQFTVHANVNYAGYDKKPEEAKQEVKQTSAPVAAPSAPPTNS